MMLKPGGYAAIRDPECGLREADTFTCKHCQRIVHVKAGADPTALGGYCRCCDGLICAACVGQPCTPWERQMEAIERGLARQRFRARLDRISPRRSEEA
jgi:hypothetical protein